MTGHALVPDIIIGGGPSSNTTFLCNLLSKHPDPPFIPEPKVCMISHLVGDPGYLERYAVLFADAPAAALRVEKTSYYLENDQARERLVRATANQI
jgi:hypothetical protein